MSRTDLHNVFVNPTISTTLDSKNDHWVERRADGITVNKYPKVQQDAAQKLPRLKKPNVGDHSPQVRHMNLLQRGGTA